MSAVLERVDPMVALAHVHTLIDGLLDLDLTGLSDDALLDYGRELEQVRRQLPALEHRFITEVEEARGIPQARFVRLVPLLRSLLRLHPHEASARVAAAHAAAPRRGLTGEQLPAAYPQVAAAQEAGGISERHAKVIVECIAKLPEQVRFDHGEQIETELVGYAHQFDPQQLGKIAARVKYCYDPDGRLEDVEHRDKQRELTVHQRPDGSSSLKGEATAELTEFLLLTFDALGAPKPAVDGVKDPRSAGQRRHDALLEALKLNVRARQLPSVAGVTATVVLTMTAEDYETRTGLARTAHGALLPVEEAMRMTGGEYRLMNVVLDKTQAIAAYSSTARLFPENARLALIATDGGCTFPDCPAPPGWCQIDHIIDYAEGGPTSVDLAVMACRYHNNDAKKQGWQSTRINGRAAWIPPPWIDPEQRPRYNELHRTDLGQPKPD